MKLEVVEIDDIQRPFVVDYIKEFWGSEKIISKGFVHDANFLDGFVVIVEEEIKGIILYNIENDECEVVTLNSMLHGYGIGTLLLETVENFARNINCERMWLITTNDNTYSLKYYQKRGFDLVKLHRNTISEYRKIKPEIPIKGHDNIKVLHELEFEKSL